MNIGPNVGYNIMILVLVSYPKTLMISVKVFFIVFYCLMSKVKDGNQIKGGLPKFFLQKLISLSLTFSFGYDLDLKIIKLPHHVLGNTVKHISTPLNHIYTFIY